MFNLYNVVPVQCCTYTMLYLYNVVPIQCCTFTMLYLCNVVPVQFCTCTMLYLLDYADNFTHGLIYTQIKVFKIRGQTYNLDRWKDIQKKRFIDGQIFMMDRQILNLRMHETSCRYFDIIIFLEVVDKFSKDIQIYRQIDRQIDIQIERQMIILQTSYLDFQLFILVFRNIMVNNDQPD